MDFAMGKAIEAEPRTTELNVFGEIKEFLASYWVLILGVICIVLVMLCQIPSDDRKRIESIEQQMNHTVDKSIMIGLYDRFRTDMMNNVKVAFRESIQETVTRMPDDTHIRDAFVALENRFTSRMEKQIETFAQKGLSGLAAGESDETAF